MSAPPAREAWIRLAAQAGQPPAGLLFDPRHCTGLAGPEALRPEHYGAAARRVGDGGRGSAWFVPSTCGDAVLREYRRGGLFGRLVRRRYLWRGEDAARCVREFRLTQRLRGLGLPVPMPLAAAWWRHGPACEQALLTAHIAGAQPLGVALARGEAQLPWAEAGALIARFHAAGLDHVDLNANNLLRDADGKLWLIDFDRCALGAPDPARASANLRRLRRSLVKLGGEQAGAAAHEAVLRGWRQAGGPGAPV